MSNQELLIEEAKIIAAQEYSTKEALIAAAHEWSVEEALIRSLITESADTAERLLIADNMAVYDSERP